MSAYLGPAGGLVPFRCPSDVDISTDRAMSYQTTLGGRVKVQRGPATRRQWSVDISSATPKELANLQALAEGGTPPWAWVEPYAQVTNMLTPEQSTLAPGTWSGTGVTEAGAVSPAGGHAPRSVAHPSGGNLTVGFRAGSPDRPAVLPGVPVSASMYLRGAGAMAIRWYDWAGAQLGSAAESYDNSSLAQVAISNQIPPEGAVSAYIVALGIQQAAMPSLSWTSDAPAWSIGRGCTRSVVDGLSESVQTAVRDDPNMRRSALSFTVREVG